MPRREAQADQPCPHLDLGAQPAGPWEVHVCCLSPRRAVCCSASTFTKTSYGPWQFHISSTTVTPVWGVQTVSQLKQGPRRPALQPGVPSPHPKWRSRRREGESLPSEFQGETPADAGVAERSCDPASSGEHEEVVYVQWPESKQRDLGVHLLFTAVSLSQTCSNPLPYEAGQTPPKHPAVLLGRHERGSPTPSIFPALRCLGTNVQKASTWPVNKKGREHLTVVWLSPWRVCMRWPSGVGDGLIWSQEIAAGLVLQMFWSFSLIFLGSVQALRPCVQDVLGCGFLFWEVLAWLPSCINSNDKIRWLWPGIMTYMCLR